MPNAARFLLTAVVITLCAGPASHAQAPVIRGFPSDAVAAERQREEQFRKVPDSARLKEYMTAMAGEPHVAGRPGSRKVAEYALGQFKSWGLDAKIESFEALMPWPTRARARDGGADAHDARHQGAGARGGSGLERRRSHAHVQRLLRDGDATGEVVYVNYGMPADYDRLEKLGVSVKGKIVLARYGGGWRGIKPKVAYEHGAVGCLIYSDPRDDGYFQGDVYPAGPFRPEQGVQRGSVMDMPDSPGRSAQPGLGLRARRRRSWRRPTPPPSSRFP